MAGAGRGIPLAKRALARRVGRGAGGDRISDVGADATVDLSVSVCLCHCHCLCLSLAWDQELDQGLFRSRFGIVTSNQLNRCSIPILKRDALAFTRPPSVLGP